MALHEYETVHIIVPDEPRKEHLQHQLMFYSLKESNIDVHIILNDNMWVRDCGPIFVVNDQGELVITTGISTAGERR